jgi:mono/diheme cytochrome c family protein
VKDTLAAVRSVPVAVSLAALVAGAAGCGQSRHHEDLVLFEQRCAACHAIAPGKLSPVPAAANLWNAHPSEADIRRAVEDGAPGMPAHLVKHDDLEHIVDFVLQETRR